SAPRTADCEMADVAAPVPVRLVARDRSDLAAVADQKPQRRIEGRARPPPLPPGVEVARRVLPVILECLVERGVEVTRLLFAQGLYRRHRRRLGTRVELDRHVEE